MKFLLHITEHTRMNLPFFILRCLGKMSKRVHKFPESVVTSLAHPCFITALVFHELCCNKIDENIFLVDAGFDLKVDLDRRDKECRSRKQAKDDKHPIRKISKPKIAMAYARWRKKHVNPLEKSNKAMNSKPTGKNFVIEETRPMPRVTRAKKKYRLNSKSILKPLLKKTTVIDVDSDTPAKLAKKKRVKFNISIKDPPALASRGSRGH